MILKRSNDKVFSNLSFGCWNSVETKKNIFNILVVHLTLEKSLVVVVFFKG